MHRVLAMATCAVAVTMTVAVGTAGAVSMAPSTGAIAGDWDVGAADNVAPGAATSLGDEFFHVEWTVGIDGHGQSHVSGRVYDDYGEPATNVELEIVAVDAHGNDLGRVMAPVRGTVPAEGNAYFDVAAPAAPAYRVRVASFDFQEPGPGK